jgi:cbb3-type cytochrome oxidase subunit 3
MEQYLTNLGLPGVVIAGLAWAYREERKRAIESQDARIADIKQFAEAVAAVAKEASKAIDALTEAVKDRK